MAELCFVAVRTKSVICCHSASLGNCSTTSKTMMRTQEYSSHVAKLSKSNIRGVVNKFPD